MTDPNRLPEKKYEQWENVASGNQSFKDWMREKKFMPVGHRLEKKNF